MVLYVFTSFEFNFELYGKMSDFDGTGVCRFNYMLINPSMKNELSMSEKKFFNMVPKVRRSFRNSIEDQIK